MIISASYKTDIPAFYGEWFMNRLRAGYCKMVNPYNRRAIRVSLLPENVDGIVFWSKNIGPASPNTIWNLYGRVVSADGTFPGSEVAMVTDPNNPEIPSLAFDGANYLLAWNVGELAINSQMVFQFFNQAASSICPEF